MYKISDSLDEGTLLSISNEELSSLIELKNHFVAFQNPSPVGGSAYGVVFDLLKSDGEPSSEAIVYFGCYSNSSSWSFRLRFSFQSSSKSFEEG